MMIKKCVKCGNKIKSVSVEVWINDFKSYEGYWCEECLKKVREVFE